MIEILNLTKKYGAKKAVDNISFKVEKGEILGFLGPNGAGKSTTMNIITGYLSATEGTVKVDGHDVLEEPNEVKKRIGYLPEQPPLYMDMTVREYLNFIYDLKKVKLDRSKHLMEVASLVKIENVINRRIGNLSKGYKQRVGLAQALVGNPEVLILDEPTVGLDPQQIIEIRNVIKDLGKDRTVILSSHILPEVSAICERIIIINNGKLVASGNPEELSRTMGQSNKLQVRIAGTRNDAERVLREIPGVRKISKLGEKEPKSFDFIVETLPNTDIRRAMFNALAQRGMQIIMLKSLDLTLEDIFMRAVNGDLSEGESFLTEDSVSKAESGDLEEAESEEEAEEGSEDSSQLQAEPENKEEEGEN